MFIKNLLFIATFCCAFTLSAQTSGSRVSIKWGKEHKTLERNAPANIIGISNNELFSWETDFGLLRKTRRYLRRYDRALNPVEESEIDLTDSKEDRDFEEVVMTKKGEIFMLSSYFNKSQNKNYLFGG